MRAKAKIQCYGMRSTPSLVRLLTAWPAGAIPRIFVPEPKNPSHVRRQSYMGAARRCISARANTILDLLACDGFCSAGISTNLEGGKAMRCDAPYEMPLVCVLGTGP